MPGYICQEGKALCATITMQRVFKCPKCGLVIDRDLNASINLLNYGRVSSTRTHMPVERGSVDDPAVMPYAKKHPLAEAGTQQSLTMVRFG
jgi:transposase